MGSVSIAEFSTVQNIVVVVVAAALKTPSAKNEIQRRYVTSLCCQKVLLVAPEELVEFGQDWGWMGSGRTG